MGQRLTEEQRDDLIDQLPDGMTLWGDDSEIAADWFTPYDYEKWLEILGHPRAHPGCCKTCGCATTCVLGTFYDAVVSSVVRELDKLGAIQVPTGKDD
ncbi:hypothetical protein [Allonocardiopsis opalescens]|uniref:Uncharacterized protein n=1 Tax=Allonocardiopsis opalescens TaxID=1144618 RepID=A0A2T0PT94_9ACTN|nr:hypothetical protein [Allonocardiopsis opalescens]PRX91936.1 hypothetical protein CLV72_1129 [Allonocardiopsis opalescens]